MELERREMSRENWPRVLRRRYHYEPISRGGFEGAVSLIYFDEVASPAVKPGAGGTPTVILDSGFAWLQLAPREGHWWLTAMLDQRGDLVQCYFDITLENCVAPQSASFIDLYLDFVLTPPGDLSRRDDDELKDALAEGAITEAEFELALSEGAALEAALPLEKERLFAFCKREYQRLLPFCQ